MRLQHFPQSDHTESGAEAPDSAEQTDKDNTLCTSRALRIFIYSMKSQLTEKNVFIHMNNNYKFIFYNNILLFLYNHISADIEVLPQQ